MTSDTAQLHTLLEQSSAADLLREMSSTRGSRILLALSLRLAHFNHDVASSC